ncbi:unnamed protein product [Rhizophagus irregularis]|nr:unnamed protein product [Rhizophagus irregularis]
MAKVATDFMERHKWTSETPSSELAKYTEEINKGLTKEQVEVLIPIRPTGKREEGRDTVDKIAQEIVDKDFPPKKIKEISNDLAGSAPNPVAGSSRLTLLRKNTPAYIDEDKGFECPEHYYLEKVQERLNKCDISSSPSKKNLVDIMIMLSMQPADVAGLSIEKYDTSDEMWYKSNYSWYCTGYSKIKGETGSGEP